MLKTLEEINQDFISRSLTTAPLPKHDTEAIKTVIPDIDTLLNDLGRPPAKKSLKAKIRRIIGNVLFCVILAFIFMYFFFQGAGL